MFIEIFLTLMFFPFQIIRHREDQSLDLAMVEEINSRILFKLSLRVKIFNFERVIFLKTIDYYTTFLNADSWNEF